MRLTITIDMDNAAFEGNPGIESGRILEVLGGCLATTTDHLSPGWTKFLRDINGNTVGRALVSVKAGTR